MKSDLTRATFKREKHYSGVRMQQGRVQLDADWNEQVDIAANRIETEARDVVGPCGAPNDNAGFEVKADDGDLLIGYGRIYVDGVLCENESDDEHLEGLPFTAQPDCPEATLPADAGDYLAYLDVWQRHITVIEDPSLREEALGNVDTTTRTKTVWQVKLLPIETSLEDEPCSQQFPEWDELVDGRLARLAARVEPTAPSDDPCAVSLQGGARVRANQLYRVEIHTPGPVGISTFKWSRDNGSVVGAVESFDPITNTIGLPEPSRDDLLAFAPGNWVEITDEVFELKDGAGVLVQLTTPSAGTTLTYDPATATGPIPVERMDTPEDRDKYKPKVRRWDQREAAEITTSSAWIELEDDIQIRFGEVGDEYKIGDYWLIPARAISGKIEWPVNRNDEPKLQERFGIRHHYCRLAALHLSDDGAWELIEDCRNFFSPLTECCDCFDHDHLRADGVVRTDDGKLGFVVTPHARSAEEPLKIRYTAGIAYVAGCHFKIAGGEISEPELDPSTTYQTLFVNDRGEVRLVVKGDLPEKYAALAIISTYDGEIKRVIDARFDLTHLDEKVEKNFQRTATARADRRQFVPLLAYSIKGLHYRDGRNRNFEIGTSSFVPFGLASDGENIWVANLSGNTIGKISREAMDVSEVEFIPITDIAGTASWAIAYDGCCLWFTIFTHDLVVRFNPSTGEIRNIQVGPEPRGIAFDGDFVWVCSLDGRSVSVIDVETCQVVRTIALFDHSGAPASPDSIAFDGSHIWIAAASNLLFKIEKPWGDPVLVTNQLTYSRGYLAFDGAHIWVSSRNSPLVKIEITTHAPETVLSDIASTHALAFDGAYLWAMRRPTALYKIDVHTNQLLGEIALSGATTAALFDGAHLWISSIEGLRKQLV